MQAHKIENQQLIRESVHEFARKHLGPHVMEWDESQYFPSHLFPVMGELGLTGMLVPEAYGGAGLDYGAYVTALIEISKTDPSMGLSLAAHNSLCTNHLLMFGDEEQKNSYLPLLASGRWIGAWGLTEAHTGSDAGNMHTVAVKDGDEWVLNGAKTFITHGISADLAVVIAKTRNGEEKHNATAFLVRKGTPGFTGGRKENKLGMRASETAEMVFRDCRVPDSHRIGAAGEGFIQALKVLDGGRISIAALSVGTAWGAYLAARDYAGVRHQFGQPIARFQGIAFKLADMYTDIQASELLTFRAAELKDAGEKVTLASAVAKYHASETAVRVAGEAVQIFGGYGFTKDYPAEKFYRDSKLCTIGEGTSEIQKLVISREILS